MQVTIEHNGTSAHNLMAEELKTKLRHFDLDIDEMVDFSAGQIALWNRNIQLGKWSRVPSLTDLEFITTAIT